MLAYTGNIEDLLDNSVQASTWRPLSTRISASPCGMLAVRIRFGHSGDIIFRTHRVCGVTVAGLADLNQCDLSHLIFFTKNFEGVPFGLDCQCCGSEEQIPQKLITCVINFELVQPTCSAF